MRVYGILQHNPERWYLFTSVGNNEGTFKDGGHISRKN